MTITPNEKRGSEEGNRTHAQRGIVLWGGDQKTHVTPPDTQEKEFLSAGPQQGRHLGTSPTMTGKEKLSLVATKV